MDVPSGGAIEFQGTFVENATRAAQTVTTANLNAFQVWGFVNAPSGVVFKETTVSKNGGAWSYDGTQYWAPDQHYYFAAVAPLSDLWSLNTKTADLTGPGILSFTNDAATDLVYAEKHVQAAGAGQVNPAVALQFQHLLSKVKLTFTNSFGIDNYMVALNGIKMTTPESAAIDLRDEHTWKEFGENMTLAFTSKELANNMTEATVEEYFILPTACGIQFDLQIYVGTVKVYEGTKTATLPADSFEMGHAYNLSAEINADVLNFDEIVFTVDKVEEWDEAPNASDAAANLLYAAQMGGTYTLTKNVELTSPVVVPAGSHFVLNLNGMTLKNQVDNAATDVIIVEEGAELVINGEGTGTVEAVSGNDGYAVIAEGKVTINGGTYKSGVDQNNEPNAVVYARGNGEVYVNGGFFPNELESKYVLNKKDADRATTVIEVRGGTFQKFNPANNAAENQGTNFVADGYVSIADGENYTVIHGTGVATPEELRDAIKDANNDCIVITEDINLTNTSVSYLHMYNEVTINMVNNALHVGDASNYSLFCNAGSDVTFENANIIAHGGGIVARDGATVAMNSGSIKIESTATGHRYMIYAYGEGTSVTINGGKFSFEQYKKRCYGIVSDGAVVYIKGGEFGPAPNHPSDSNMPFIVDGGQVIITGGTFGFDPSAWVASGYKAVKNGSTWTVVAE